MIRGSGSFSLLAWIVSFTTLTTLAVVLRFWSARIQRRKFYLDDGLVIASYIGMLIQQGVGIWSLSNGFGNSTPDYTAPELLVQAKVLVASSVTWIWSTTFVKLAVLALYRRLFITATFKKWATSLMVIDAAFGITFFFVFLTHCIPISQQWNPVPGGWCRSETVNELTSISINLVIDTAIVLLPMPWLWRLQMPFSKKVLVTVMFSFGFTTIAIMAYRLQQAADTEANPAVTSAKIGLLSSVELWLGIIVACLPTLAPFVKAYVQPHLLTISRKFSNTHDLGSEEGAPKGQLITLGGSGGSGPKIRSNYTELTDVSTDLHV